MDDLHSTSTLADSVALPHRLLASHLYSPASLLLIFVNTNSVPLVRWPLLTLIQDTDGEGMPDAIQERVTLPPSIIASSAIGWMDDGTVSKQTNKQHIKKFRHHRGTESQTMKRVPRSYGARGGDTPICKLYG